MLLATTASRWLSLVSSASLLNKDVPDRYMKRITDTMCAQEIMAGAYHFLNWRPKSCIWPSIPVTLYSVI